MPYPLKRLGRMLLPGIAILFIYSTPARTPNHPENTLYKSGDTVLVFKHSGVVRHEPNGDVVISIPAGAMGRFRIRFFDEKNAFLFEIRQISDPLLIIEKYNFGHSGLFQYELYRDNELVEKNSFHINP